MNFSINNCESPLSIYGIHITGSPFETDRIILKTYNAETPTGTKKFKDVLVKMASRCVNCGGIVHQSEYIIAGQLAE